MALPSTLNDREHRKFVELVNGQTAVVTTNGDVMPTNPIKANPSLVFNISGGICLSVEQTINSITYTKTYSHDGSGNLIGISGWT